MANLRDEAPEEETPAEETKPEPVAERIPEAPQAVAIVKRGPGRPRKVQPEPQPASPQPKIVQDAPPKQERAQSDLDAILAGFSIDVNPKGFGG
jgi:hypothetical protein